VLGRAVILGQRGITPSLWYTSLKESVCRRLLGEFDGELFKPGADNARVAGVEACHLGVEQLILGRLTIGPSRRCEVAGGSQGRD